METVTIYLKGHEIFPNIHDVGSAFWGRGGGYAITYKLKYTSVGLSEGNFCREKELLYLWYLLQEEINRETS